MSPREKASAGQPSWLDRFWLPLVITILAGVILLWLEYGSGWFQPPPAASTTFNLPGRSQWLGTGVHVRQGQTLIISASGIINTNQGGPERDASPEGDAYACVSDCFLNGAHYGALVGKIGPNGLPFVIGSSLSLPVDQSGELLVVANDNVGALMVADNTGSFLIVIEVR